jgi:hypothetical protein
MMFDPQRAEAFAPSQKAVMPCGCLAVMLGRAGARVQFGIEETACGRHRVSEIASVDKNELLTPAGPFEPFGG